MQSSKATFQAISKEWSSAGRPFPRQMRYWAEIGLRFSYASSEKNRIPQRGEKSRHFPSWIGRWTFVMDNVHFSLHAQAV